MINLESPVGLDEESVKARVTDWISRLEKLYAHLDTWVRGVPNAIVSRNVKEQVIELPMKQFGVPAQAVPTYTVLLERKWRVAFLPSVIWIVGANGRVDIITNVSQHTLLDVGGRNGAPSDWRLVVSDARKLVIPFGKPAFLGLLRKRR